MSWNDNKIHVSKRGFHCAYCDKKRVGAYKVVDGAKSCEKCNREYDAEKCTASITCPLCKGVGHFTHP